MGERADEIDRYNVPRAGQYEDEFLEPAAPTAASVPLSEDPEAAYAPDATFGAGVEVPDLTDETAPADADDDIEATRAQIEQKRSEMSETIDAIQEKLSPSNLMEQAKETVKDATVGRAQTMISNATDAASDAASNVTDSAKGFGATIVETVRQNPVPAALAGLGLGWLFMSARKSSSSSSSYDRQNYGAGYRGQGYNAQYDYGYTPARGSADGESYGGAYRAPYGGAYGGTDQGAYRGAYQGTDQGSNQSTLGQVQDTVGGAAGQVADAAGQAVSQVQDTAGQVVSGVQDTASQVASNVQNTAGQVVNQAQYGAQAAASGFQQMLEERPLAVAAGAVALGVAVGLAIPTTSQENQLMGEARDNLVQQAQDSVQDAAQRVQSVAQQAVQTAKDEAQQQFSGDQSS